MSGQAGKTAVAKTTASPGTRASYRDVVWALQTDYARFLALGLYRRAGYMPKDFALQRARAAMAVALTTTEDALELRGSRREREAIRAVRRRLEQEVWS